MQLFHLQSIIIALAVVISGAHLKDVLKAQSNAPATTVKAMALDDGQQTKVVAEVHPHIDKQTGKTFYGNDVAQYIGRRFSSLQMAVSKWNSLELRAELALWLQLFGWRYMNAPLLS